MAEYFFDFKGAQIDNGSSGVHTFIAGNVQPAVAENQEILQELSVIRTKLKTTEPLLANAVENLEQAIREQDKPKISKIVGQLSVGTAASVLAEFANRGLRAFLGLPLQALNSSGRKTRSAGKGPWSLSSPQPFSEEGERLGGGKKLPLEPTGRERRRLRYGLRRRARFYSKVSLAIAV